MTIISIIIVFCGNLCCFDDVHVNCCLFQTIMDRAFQTSKNNSLSAHNTSYTAGPTWAVSIIATISSSDLSVCHGAASSSVDCKYFLWHSQILWSLRKIADSDRQCQTLHAWCALLSILETYDDPDNCWLYSLHLFNTLAAYYINVISLTWYVL